MKKLFRFRFIVLGLLLCIFHVWCRTCGTVFTDPASSTYLANIVIEGTISQKLPIGEDLYRVRVFVKRVRKGDSFLTRGRRTRKIIIGEFSDANVSKENCIPSIKSDNRQNYFFFLKNSTNGLVNTAFPVVVTKKNARDVRKLACRKCDKSPTLKTIKVRKKYVEGKKIQLSCRIRSARPAPQMLWEKNGKVLETKKNGFVIRKTKRGIVLRKRKAKLSDSGTYVCQARNVIGIIRQEVKIEVSRSKKRPNKPNKPNKNTKLNITTPTPAFSESDVTPTLFYPCPPKYQGKCFNGGTCDIIADLGIARCRCPATHTGDRCEYRKMIFKSVSKQEALEKDRTLTIIGIVIGILVFVCICIASYLLAKRRRNQFFKRQAEKRQQLDQKKHIPPSYSKLPSLDEVSELSKFKFYERIPMNHRETQTDETSIIAPNPNTNFNLYLNPVENEVVLRNADPRRNSRSRLSGVSDGRRSQPLSSSHPQNGNSVYNPGNGIEEDGVNSDGSIHQRPKIPKFSEVEQSSDEEEPMKNSLPSLYIGDEDQYSASLTRSKRSNPPSVDLSLEDQSSPPIVRSKRSNPHSADLTLEGQSFSPIVSTKRSNQSIDHSSEDQSDAPLLRSQRSNPPSINLSLDSSPMRNGGKINPIIVYTPTSNSDSTSEHSTSSECSTWSKEELKNKKRTSESEIHNDNGYAWNERGSPEVLRRTNRRRSSSDARKASITNQNEMYSHLATSGADFRIYDLRDDDVPAIPV